MSIIGQKRLFTIGGRVVPGTVVGEPRAETIQVPSKDPARNGALVTLRIERADVITLRTTNPANGPVREYLALSPENLRFGVPRFTNVVGLDVTEDGEVIDLQMLSELTAQSIADYQSARLAAQAEPEVAL